MYSRFKHMLSKLNSLNIAVLFISVLIISGLAGCRSTPELSPGISGYEQQVFQLVNNYRQSRSQNQLEWNDLVAGAARQHSKNMASGLTDFSHNGFSGRVKTISSKIKLQSAAENLAMVSGYSQPATLIVNQWLNSPDHLKNISGHFLLTGVGAALCNETDTYYFTQIFVDVRP